MRSVKRDTCLELEKHVFSHWESFVCICGCALQITECFNSHKLHQGVHYKVPQSQKHRAICIGLMLRSHWPKMCRKWQTDCCSERNVLSKNWFLLLFGRMQHTDFDKLASSFLEQWMRWLNDSAIALAKMQTVGF